MQKNVRERVGRSGTQSVLLNLRTSYCLHYPLVLYVFFNFIEAEIVIGNFRVSPISDIRWIQKNNTAFTRSHAEVVKRSRQSTGASARRVSLRNATRALTES